MSASVKLRFLDEDGVTEHSKRFAVSDDSSTVAEAIQNGLDRLECSSLTCQLVMHGQRRGSGKPFRVRMDDYIELGYDYVFVDPRLEDSNVPSFSTPSTPTTSTTMASRSPAPFATPTSSRRPVATVATPTTSQRPFARRRNDSPDLFGDLFEQPSMAVPPPTPTTPTRESFAKLVMAAPPPSHDLVSMDDCDAEPSTSAAASNERRTAPAASPKFTTISKTRQLDNFYISNQQAVDDFYIDVVYHMGLFHHRKAAFFVLCQQQHPELYEAAQLDVPPSEKQSIAKLVSSLTGFTDLQNMTFANRNGRLDFKIKNFRRYNRDWSTGPPPAKRAKMAAVTDSEIDLLSVELNPETDSKALHGAYERTAKFRHIVSDVSLIHYDFTYLMSVRRHPLSSLAESFRRLVPAIYEEARVLGISTTTTVTDSTDKREYMAGQLLSEILKLKCKKSPNDYGRLVIDHTGSLDYKNAMQWRKHNGITAPSILILGSDSAITFYIAADGMVFQVRGRFAEALQSYMEMVFVSNVKYDSKTTGITYFFEYLMNIKDHQNASRMAVKKELDAIAAWFCFALQHNFIYSMF
uniref:Uncharacterized protein n=1 Tax=Panagrolaimus davidi TaxID=227884 RepID=A0A914R1Q4_9BILA